MADRLNPDRSFGASRILTRQLRQVRGGHVGLKPDTQSTRQQCFYFPTLVFCFLVSIISPLNAEELPDPTRPPALIIVPGSAETAPTPAGLQSIIISQTRRAAIIDGETIELGGKHAGAKLIEVNEGSVVLRGAQGRQVMTLFPDVKMTMVRTPVKREMEIDPKAKTNLQLPKSKAQPEKQKANRAAPEEKK